MIKTEFLFVHNTLSTHQHCIIFLVNSEEIPSNLPYSFLYYVIIFVKQWQPGQGSKNRKILERSPCMQGLVTIADHQVTSLSGSEDEVPIIFFPGGTLPSRDANNKYFPNSYESNSDKDFDVAKVLQYKSTHSSSPKVCVRYVPMNVSFLHLKWIVFYSCSQNMVLDFVLRNRNSCLVCNWRSDHWYRSEGSHILV